MLASSIGGAASGAANWYSQQYQWQQMFQYQQNQQNFSKDLLLQQLQKEQEYYQDNLILRARLNGMNTAAAVMRRSVEQDNSSIGTASDLLEDPHSVPRYSNSSTAPNVDVNEFPIMGPYNPSIATEASVFGSKDDGPIATPAVNEGMVNLQEAHHNPDIFSKNYTSNALDSSESQTGVQKTKDTLEKNDTSSSSKKDVPSSSNVNKDEE